MIQAPLLDAFGTRLDPSDLMRGLAGFGLAGARLTLRDDGATLEVAGLAPGAEPVMRAVTWLRGELSPLVPVAVTPLPTDALASVNIVDERRRLPHTIALAEVDHPPDGVDQALADVLERLGYPAAATPSAAAPAPAPVVDDPAHQARLTDLAARFGAQLGTRGQAARGATVTWLAPTEAGFTLQTGGDGPGPHLVAWARPGGPTGPRPALILAAARSGAALGWLVAALHDPPGPLPDVPVLLDGLTWGVARRPTLAVPVRADDPSPIRVDPDRCTSCGLCAAVCPTDFLDLRGRPATEDMAACIRCYDCVETCPTDALRPVYAADAATRGDLPSLAEGWLARLRGAPGPAEPTPFPPSFLTPRPADAPPPRVILGLAVMTQQEHAAALVVDGRLVGAVEEEKLVRVRHFGWQPRNGPRFRNLGVDPTLTLEQVLCRRSIRVLLAEAGLTLDDVDVIALNGLPSRYRRALPILDPDAPIPALRAGRVLALPHHLCHAASAYRASGFDAAWVLTVDGRGDRETAALFRADGDAITPQETALSLTDRSIGGVYETVTRLLGFGSHGQGSVMALAAFGTPSDAMRPFLSATDWDDLSVHEHGIAEAFADRARAPDDPLGQAQYDLAASLQAALEDTLLTLARDGVGAGAVDALCLAGGVTLNCRANNRLRLALGTERVFAQPGANDAGTALGAALEAAARLTDTRVAPMRHAAIGPAFDEADIAAALARAGVAWTRPDDVAEAVAERIAAGQVVCWFQGRLEFGPRALGSRSIVADPRDPAIKDRVNGIKRREPWRPFGPSILAGHEAEWFEDGFDAPFMLFTLPVREAKRAAVPAVVHVDGTTRPQSVHAAELPEYHRMIAAFHARTGVPMVLNTSFNRRGEPIVCTPADALASFAGLGADALAIGPFIVERGARATPLAPWPVARDAILRALPGGRRLALRATTRCDLACVHCTLGDHPARDVDAAPEDLVRALVAGREAGCDELVVMRGEPTARTDLLPLVARARAMGYRFVQLQTHGRRLSQPAYVQALRKAGVDAVEVMLLGADPALHDALARTTGAFRETLAGLQLAVRAGLDVLVSVAVMRANAPHLRRIARLVQKVGVKRLQLGFPRPVERADGVPTEHALRLADAAAHINRAARYATGIGIIVSTEGVPMCLLDPALHNSPDSAEDFARHRIDDLGLVHERFDRVRERMRPDAAPCRACAARAACPRTWSLYLEVFGSAELRAM